jgi:hypothetical protein
MGDAYQALMSLVDMLDAGIARLDSLLGTLWEAKKYFGVFKVGNDVAGGLQDVFTGRMFGL